jgi:hypothetical protein|tara:strand:+ start:84 stop:467 length:384 start_codon:yes stop_codon:yes gene_type:complete
VKLSDYLNSINYTKENLFNTEDELVEKEYVPFVINRCLSYFPDTTIHANAMNENSHIDKKMQYDYFLHSTRKRKRFSKWLKREDSDKINIMKRYFGYSNQKVREIEDMISDSDIDEMRDFLSHGGKK